ncbi:hypothetical protein GEMRC1_000891 [Eukaryota sp. GEM-RC1]
MWHHFQPMSKTALLEATRTLNPNFPKSGWVEASNLISKGMIVKKKERLYSLTSEGLEVIQRAHAALNSKNSPPLPSTQLSDKSIFLLCDHSELTVRRDGLDLLHNNGVTAIDMDNSPAISLNP